MKVLGFAGYSGSGKTTLIEKLIPELAQRGLRVSVLKHAHHRFDVDQPGKDSHRVRQAGAGEVLIASGNRWALMHELRGAAEPTLQQLLQKFASCDLVIVEGYKREPIDRIEVHRRDAGTPLLYSSDERVIAIATDEPLQATISQLNLNNIAEVADFVMQYVRKPTLRMIGG